MDPEWSVWLYAFVLGTLYTILKKPCIAHSMSIWEGSGCKRECSRSWFFSNKYHLSASASFSHNVRYPLAYCSNLCSLSASCVASSALSWNISASACFNQTIACSSICCFLRCIQIETLQAPCFYLQVPYHSYLV